MSLAGLGAGLANTEAARADTVKKIAFIFAVNGLAEDNSVRYPAENGLVVGINT
jgi:hypothetical protein